MSYDIYDDDGDLAQAWRSHATADNSAADNSAARAIRPFHSRVQAQYVLLNGTHRGWSEFWLWEHGLQARVKVRRS